MTQEHHANLGIEFRKEADKHWARTLFFGALLLISHLLTIEPSEVEAEGIKIAIGDVAVIQGGIALVFFYYLFKSINLLVHGALLMPFSAERRMSRWFLHIASAPSYDSALKRRRRPTPKERKRSARWGIGVFQAIMVPYYLTAMAVVISAFLFAVTDVYSFGTYSIDKWIADQEAAEENEINALVNKLREERRR